jgi:vacuolar-type H+-ATPase subunit C/Vma6
MMKAETPEAFATHLPPGSPRKLLSTILAAQRDVAGPFLFEAALDSGHYQELLARIQPLADEDRAAIEPLVREEVEFFHFQLVVRGKFNHGLTPGSLAALAVSSSGAAAGRFEAMLAGADIATVAKIAVSHVFDELPATRNGIEMNDGFNPATLEALAWNRLLRLANGAFRRSHMGLGAVVGYLQLRRMEVANLITLSEGIRTGMAAEKIRARLIPRGNTEALHV